MKSPQEELLEAARQALRALLASYNVRDYPADGETDQDKATKALTLAVKAVEETGRWIETPEEAYERGQRHILLIMSKALDLAGLWEKSRLTASMNTFSYTPPPRKES